MAVGDADDAADLVGDLLAVASAVLGVAVGEAYVWEGSEAGADEVCAAVADCVYSVGL